MSLGEVGAELRRLIERLAIARDEIAASNKALAESRTLLRGLTRGSAHPQVIRALAQHQATGDRLDNADDLLSEAASAIIKYAALLGIPLTSSGAPPEQADSSAGARADRRQQARAGPLTRPSLPPDDNRLPSGNPTEVHPTRNKDRGKRRENESAITLARHGYQIQQNPPTRSNGRNPDYLLEGRYFDCYAPSTTNPDEIRKELSEKTKKGQADRFIVNLDDCIVDVEQIRAALTRRQITDMHEVLAIKNGRIVQVHPRPEDG
ncbi:hypothetical protein GCM10027290_64680 [Micromonospora sonneratiae]|uniref:tRNA nuclease CdiA C-terminal domain-containing protein n=1 Tax=Micromonospora sonneratiae TaxID=1184706 RepID=A0ABW3YAV6_9ACTN